MVLIVLPRDDYRTPIRHTVQKTQGAHIMPDSATELLERPADEAAESEIAAAQPDELVAAELLVEEISIDGMCGVY
jgi:mycofactocin precursor